MASASPASSERYLLGMPGFTAYAASKAAVRNFARGWTMELKDRGIRVNTMSPGAIDTPALATTTGLTAEQAEQAVAQFTSMTVSNTMFTVFSGIGLILSVIPLWWHLGSRNVGTYMYGVWTAIACLVHFVDSIVWDGNTLNRAPVWCDIGTPRCSFA